MAASEGLVMYCGKMYRHASEASKVPQQKPLMSQIEFWIECHHLTA